VLTWPAPQIPELPGRGSTIRIHDSSSGEQTVAALGEAATLYVCGITPYDATHIGHAATYVAFDLLGRAWRDAGKTVTYASNVTDVDDPLLERATATGVDWRDLAVEQTALFAEDMTALSVIPPDVYLGAVETIAPVAEAVADLVRIGAAYRVPLETGAGGTQPELGDVYADITADVSFGDVSHMDPETMRALFAERGGDPERVGKRNVLDPLLWRRERPGEPAWEAGSLGTGRPGWHIECAVIARVGLGYPFDVQGGGSDLLFPHHEMSTSHARLLGDGEVHGVGALAHMHAGLVAYEGEKMSKSRGNLVFVSRLRADGVEPMAIRLTLLAHHYRTEWEWTDEGLAEGVLRLETWRAAVSGNGGPDAAKTLEQIRAALADDLDAPRALTAVDEWAAQSLAGDPNPIEGAPGVISRTVNSLLGVRL
jgi:L-cysteine:1D-myo-inositol 2-amino-2-deoxy-alpha-D-glucopyranoside ligase